MSNPNRPAQMVFDDWYAAVDAELLSRFGIHVTEFLLDDLIDAHDAGIDPIHTARIFAASYLED